MIKICSQLKSENISLKTADGQVLYVNIIWVEILIMLIKMNIELIRSKAGTLLDYLLIPLMKNIQ